MTAAVRRVGTRRHLRRGVGIAVVVASIAAGAVTPSSPVGATAPDVASVAPANVVRFTDVPTGAYYSAAVDWLVAENITSGVSTNPPQFGPGRSVTRAQMALFIWRLMESPEASTSCGFADVPSSAVFAQAACWLKDNGVTSGFAGDATRFAPAVVVTRSQMALFLWRLGGEAPSTTTCGFTDVPSTAPFTPAACWLKARGITTGAAGDPTKFGPSGPVSRAQMAAFLDRMASTHEAWRITAPAAAKFDCEVLDPRTCLLPFPSNHFTRTDAVTDTGLRLAFARTSMPANAQGIRIDTVDQNRGDGFSPGSALMFHAPTADLEASGAAPITDIGSSLDPDAPVVIVNTETGERHPHWVELDAQNPLADDKITYVRPAVNFEEGVRYVVGIRNLVDGDGAPLESSPAFAALRDGVDVATLPDRVAERATEMESVFEKLTDSGVERSELYLAWDFTVASARSLSGRLLHMRDTAFTALGDDAPTFTVRTGTVASPNPVVADGLRKLDGTISVPNFLQSDGAPGTRFNDLGTNGLPKRNPTKPSIDVPFWCVIPTAATADDPARLVMSGHGLLGTGEELKTGSSFDWAARDGNAVLCAVDLWGMSGRDILTIAAQLQDLSLFRGLADRGQQSLLNFLFLGRAMLHADGFGSHPAFQDAQGRSVLDTSELFYNGNSMGGIMGGALMAVAQDMERALLGVPGMNYSTLLDRSVLAQPVFAVGQGAYPNPIERPLGLHFVQLLWDRSEANGYAHHVTSDPYPNTPTKELLFFMAYADEAVANITTEVMARTMDIPVRAPVLNTSRATGADPAVEPLWGIDRITSFPHRGSGMVVWDFGNPPPPTQNIGPSSTPGYPDPHAAGGRLSAVRTLVFDYLTGDGVLNDVCPGVPCAGPRDL